MITLFLNHYKEMLIGYIKGIYIRIIDPQRYDYLKRLRGDYRALKTTKHTLVEELITALDHNNIKDYVCISRIKTIGSIERKDKYIKITNKGDHSDGIGIRFIAKNTADCYKIMDILIRKYTLQTGEDVINPEDFFKNPKIMRNTDSIAKNHIFVKIIFETFPIHIIIMPKSDYVYIHQQRKKYLRFIYKTIKNK